MAGLSVAAALAQAAAAGLDRLSAQRLLGRALGRPREWLIAHDDALLTPAQAARFLDDAARRADGVPLAYLLGEREFHGLALQVGPAVLDPRPDTEALVDWALDVLGHRPAATVADLGTGSGAIALALAAAAAQRDTNWQVHASDASPAALAMAQANAQRLGLPVHFATGSWWQAWPRLGFDLVASNPPYIAADDPHLPALKHEPRMALVSGPDGLDDIRQIVAGAPQHLNPGAWLLLEHGWQQADAVAALLAQAGFGDVQHRLDLAGHRRCTGGRWR
ncbi:protein-(glutamine-N5) methyltransferase, release factor-specific [Burkholderiales bacterium JOSHI_001]|nr:protein-(glutamine-N5) methyltransferase, release factor-specific [Burkholderiales bacterium JOSHI_001]